MAGRVLFFDDDLEVHRVFAAELRKRGYDLIRVGDLEGAAQEVAHPDFSAVVYGGRSAESWSVVQSLMVANAELPVVFLFAHDDSREAGVQIDELRQVARPLTNLAEFIAKVEQVARIGRLHRRIHELSQIAGGSNSLEQMFTRLDVHHILDRVLAYFGTRQEMRNLHWVRWQDLPHFLEGEAKSLALELEVVAGRSPRLLSYLPVDSEPLLKFLREVFRGVDLSNLARQDSATIGSGLEPTLVLPVHSLNDGPPLGVLVLEGIEREFQDGVAAQIQGALKLMARYIEFGLSHWDSKNLAMVDDLTELYNQRFLPVVLDNEINRLQRRGGHFTVLFMDLDHFKLVNDTRGHWIGSRLLAQVAQIVKKSIRSCDYGFRYGGDEFVVVLTDTDISSGQIVAERIRKSVESMPFLIEGHELRLTVSVGMAGYPDHARTREQIVQLADQAMYCGKRKKRNVVYIAS